MTYIAVLLIAALTAPAVSALAARSGADFRASFACGMGAFCLVVFMATLPFS